MSAGTVLANLSKSPATSYAILGIVGIIAFVVIENAIKSLAGAAGDAVDKAASAAGSAGTAVIDAASGFATGTGSVTANTPYAGDGIFGSLGAATDKLFGGGLSAFGGWVGDKVYDATHDDESVSLNLSNNGANNNPYGGGNNILYSGAVDNAPVPAAGGSAQGTSSNYAANPNANAPLGANPGDW